MQIELLSFTPEPEKVVSLAARCCYREGGVCENWGLQQVDERLLRNLLKNEHMSPFEHASFTFGVDGISRVTSHQLVRHRIASFSQQSQRYIPMHKQKCVIPESVLGNIPAELIFMQAQDSAMSSYKQLVDLGVPEEDARYILPHGLETKLVFTMNARELRHFFTLRMCNRSQWEIRSMANRMLELCKIVAPIIFEDAGSACMGTGCCNPCKNPRDSIV